MNTDIFRNTIQFTQDGNYIAEMLQTDFLSTHQLYDKTPLL